MLIQLPFPSDFSANTYQELKQILKQFELTIHHAQKAVENAEKDNVGLSDDAGISLTYPCLDEDTFNNYYIELQQPSLNINLE